MADINKRIVVDVDAKDAEQSLSPVKRVLEDIQKSAELSGEAVSSAFENAFRTSKSFEEILEKVKREFSELQRTSPDFGKEISETEKRFRKEIEETAPGRRRSELESQRDRELSQLREDKSAQEKFEQEFSENAKRLTDALKDAVDQEKETQRLTRGGGEGSYLGGLFAQRSALLSKQLSAPTRKEAQSYTKDINRITEQISSTQSPNRLGGRMAGQAGLGIAGALFGMDTGMFGALAGGPAMIIAEMGKLLMNSIRDGLETMQQTNRASLVSSGSISPYGPVGPNGENLESGAFDVRTGMSPAERTNYYVNYIRQRGMGGRYSGIGAYEQALTENAFGIDRGGLMGLNRFSIRDTSGVGVNNLVQAFVQASQQGNLFGFQKDDFSQLTDRISNVIQLIRDQQQNMNSINMASGFSTIMMGQQIGGRFADRDTQVGLFNQLNSSIRNPGNDFRRAFIYQRLQQANPGASHFQLMEQMQNGIYGGNLQAILGGLNTPGAGASQEEIDNYLLQVQGLTGLDYQAAGTLGRSIINNPNILSSQTGTTRLLQQIGANPQFRDLQGRGVSERAEAALTLTQDVKSFFKQLSSDFGVKLNELIKGNGDTNTLLKSILENSTHPMIPGAALNPNGNVYSYPTNNTTHKSEK